MMDARVPPFQTNAPLTGGGYSAPFPVWSMKVTAINVGGNPKLATAVMCNFKGLILGTRTYTIALLVPHPVNDLIFVFMPGGGTGQTFGSRTITWMELPSPLIGALFRVKLTQTGGATGTQTTAATWTYTVKDLNDNTLGTAISPERPRPKGTRTAGVLGMAYFDTTGALKLADADETPGTGPCPTPP